MANMIEQSLLCKVLDAPDLEILHSNGVIEEMFLTCKDEIHFIIEHYNSYKQMPDKLTFLGRFKDFQMLEVTESTDYLVYKLKEAYTYTKLVPLIEDTAKIVKEDSIKAIQYLKEEIEKLEKSVPVSRNKDGYDIISNAGDRLTEYKKRCEVKGLIGIPTGIPNEGGGVDIAIIRNVIELNYNLGITDADVNLFNTEVGIMQELGGSEDGE